VFCTLSTISAEEPRSSRSGHDEQGRLPVEQQERALQLSNEALGLLAQIRGPQAKK